MDFSLFGIGFPQLMLILVIGVFVFGPERLPGMARQAGRFINELRRLTQDARGEISSLTKELDIREDLNSVKNDLINIRNDLTATAASVTKDFESVRKDITLKNDEGETMGAQREQYTYKVTDAPTADGGEAVKVEETITRETIIQDAIEDTPASATEVVTDLSSGQIAPALETATVPALEGETESIIRPATPTTSAEAIMMQIEAEAKAKAEKDAPTDAPTDALTGDLTATEIVTITTNGTEPADTTANGTEPPRKSNAGMPLLEIEPSRAANPFAVAYDMPEPEPTPPAPAPDYALASIPAASTATSQVEWEEKLAKTRQEFNERLDQMEIQLKDRLDRVEKLLASQFLRAHQE
jgi:sec-independent protein translocase protein TatB